MFGWMGNILRVDLSAGVISKEALDASLCQKYLGERGLAAAYYQQSPQDAFVIMTGPLTGLFGVCTGRYHMAARSALTGAYTKVNCGGHFGPELKMAGFDGLVIQGSSKQPVYLYIKDGKAELRPAAHLWGLNIEKTAEALEKELKGEKKPRICRIGVSGEKLSPFATVVGDDENSAGGAGLGAVWGGKNLKAIAVQGSLPLEVAQPEQYLELALAHRKTLMDNPASVTLSAGGVQAFELLREHIGSRTLRGFREGIDQISRKQLCSSLTPERHMTKRRACFSCPVGCRRFSSIGVGIYAGEGWGSEGEALASFGPCLDGDKEASLFCYWLCQEEAVDPLALGQAINARGLREFTLICKKIVAAALGEEQLVLKSLCKLPEFAAYVCVCAQESAPEMAQAGLAALESVGICPYCCEVMLPDKLAAQLQAATGATYTTEDVLAAGASTLLLEEKLRQN